MLFMRRFFLLALTFIIFLKQGHTKFPAGFVKIKHPGTFAPPKLISSMYPYYYKYCASTQRTPRKGEGGGAGEQKAGGSLGGGEGGGGEGGGEGGGGEGGGVARAPDSRTSARNGVNMMQFRGGRRGPRKSSPREVCPGRRFFLFWQGRGARGAVLVGRVLQH